MAISWGRIYIGITAADWLRSGGWRQYQSRLSGLTPSGNEGVGGIPAKPI